ncbi:MAG TPA: hypothetical protein VM513_28345, partial [Kofleriaceae bacterium]|nr:hypothetical protein [Kofleriaceae bacterium]
QQAYDLLGHADDATTAEDLMLVADVMRLTSHPGEAVAPLRRVIDEHAADPRAPLAAFTLGRVMLEQLGRPADAADAFARAADLAPDGPLAEDAAARQVEARSRAGDAREAKRLAIEYLRRYPHGRQVPLVLRFGGIK